MTSPLKGPIAKVVGQALKSTLYPIAVNKVTGGGEYDPETGGVTPPTITAYACRGFVDSYSSYEIANGIAQATDRKVLILATTLAITPNPATDTVTANGQTLTIIGVKSDPAGATWELQCR